MNADAVWALSEICGMNQRYHQYEVSYWTAWNTSITIVVAIVALLSFAFSLVSFLYRKQWAGITSLVVSAISMVLAVILNISPTDANARFYSDMFRRWSDLRQEVDSLLVTADAAKKGEPSAPWIFDRYQELLAKKNSLNALEPAPDWQLLQRCQNEEERSRGLPPYHAPSKQTVAAISK
jgi:hypothetical protein